MNHFDPGEFRKPLPVNIIYALTGVALQEGDWSEAAMYVLLFAGMIRPGEVLKARREHLVPTNEN